MFMSSVEICTSLLHDNKGKGTTSIREWHSALFCLMFYDTDETISVLTSQEATRENWKEFRGVFIQKMLTSASES